MLRRILSRSHLLAQKCSNDKYRRLTGTASGIISGGSAVLLIASGGIYKTHPADYVPPVLFCSIAGYVMGYVMFTHPGITAASCAYLILLSHKAYTEEK